MKTKRNLAVMNMAGCLLAAGALLGSACSQTEDVKADPTGSVPPAHGEAGAQNVRHWACPQGIPGAKMVLISVGDGEAYCMDERETVYAEYKEFLHAKGEDTTGQPAQCDWNDSFVPDLSENSLDCLPEHWQIDTEPNRAVNCVDVCDAWSYCRWAGKRMCGVRGGDPAKLNVFGDDEVGQIGTSIESEWFNVCSQGGKTKYPYGDTYEPGICIDESKVQASGDGVLEVRDESDSDCHGAISPYCDVSNMSGSISEWVNICRNSGCVVQGGHYSKVAGPESLACAESLGVAATPSQNFARGIRCCADAVPGSSEDGG